MKKAKSVNYAMINVIHIISGILMGITLSMIPTYLQPQIEQIEEFILEDQRKFEIGIRDRSLSFREAKELLISIKEAENKVA